jgi:hypothetical protein
MGPIRSWLRQAYVSTWGLIERQASMLSFVDTFMAMGVVFLLVLPLLVRHEAAAIAGPWRRDALRQRSDSSTHPQKRV